MPGNIIKRLKKENGLVWIIIRLFDRERTTGSTKKDEDRIHYLTSFAKFPAVSGAEYPSMTTYEKWLVRKWHNVGCSMWH